MRLGAALCALFAVLAAASLLAPRFSRLVSAATNIDAAIADHWAWSDILGWIDFYDGGNSNITVTSQKLTGYASSSAGYISLDCATAPGGQNICGTSNYGVINDGAGNLSGWGWNDVYGWFSFYCGNTSGCGTSSYRVYIDASGNFQDYAWNDALGWVSFNCANTSGCGTSSYKVKTSWVATSTAGTLDSSTFDTGVAGGAQVNSILWSGSLPAGTAVSFQLAGSNSASGPWVYQGPDGTANTWYYLNATNVGAGPGESIRTDYVLHNNARYFRYRVKLVSNQSQTASPSVDAIHINWSR